MKYFAYGSNMSESRMINRGIKQKNKQLAFLDNYKFIINKRSYKDARIGYANVIKDENSTVEGILYEINDNDILKLDKFEGAPKHYTRNLMELRLSDGTKVKGMVYIANFGWTSPRQLATTTEYKNYILEGKQWLSERYFNMLNESIRTK